MSRFLLPVLAPTLSLFIACGGSSPPPEAPAPAAPAEPSPASDGGMEELAEQSEAESETESESEADSDSDEGPRRTPKEIVASETMLFRFDFRDSEAYQKAEKECGEKAGDDPKKKADCMTKARDQFDVDSIGFRKDEDGKWWWYSIQRRGKQIKTLHKIEVEFGEETDDTVVVKTKGRDMGQKPMRPPKELVIHVPSEMEIFIEDPKHGKMVYEAKVGLIGKSER